MKISIIGLGWFGAPLGKSLKKLGHDISGTTTSDDKLESLKDLRPEILKYPMMPSENLLKTDIIILNIPPFPEELEWFQSWPFPKDVWMIFISTTSGNLVHQEEWVMKHFSRWSIIRFGGLLGGSRHPGKYLSGRKDLKMGKSPVNLIHLDDTIGLTEKIIADKIMGKMIFGVCDEHSTREEFYTDYCRRSGLPLPEFDQNDETVKATVSNEETKLFYEFKRPRLLGTSL